MQKFIRDIDEHLHLVVDHVPSVSVAGDPGVVPQPGEDEGDDHVEVLDTLNRGYSIDKLVDISLFPDKQL